MCAMATDETICQLARLAKEVVDKIKTEHVAHQHKTWKLFSKNSAVNTLQQLRNYSFEQATVAVQRIIDEGLFETIIPDSAILSGHPGDALRYRAAPCLRKLAETSSSVPVPSKFRPRQRRQHRQHEVCLAVKLTLALRKTVMGSRSMNKIPWWSRSPNVSTNKLFT
eukprot:m.169374 g.169374  ORF g.169374 m.169374 type:complete len:167 (-) comp16668_c0_seq16:1997-2497(-)